MMAYQRDRDDFIAQASKAGLPLDTIQSLLRYSTILHRLAEAQCNGDWPYGNGERKTIPCPVCESGTVPFQLKSLLRNGIKIKACPDCRTTTRVKELLADSPFQPEFNGDPRGAVLRLHLKESTRDEIDSGRSRGWYVPSSRR